MATSTKDEPRKASAFNSYPYKHDEKKNAVDSEHPRWHIKPKLEVPRFDGNPFELPTYISPFKFLVHDQPLSDIKSDASTARSWWKY